VKLSINDEPGTEKETRILRSCFLNCVEIVIDGVPLLCLVFEELDMRTILPMTYNLGAVEDIRNIVERIAEMRESDEPDGRSFN